MSKIGACSRRCFTTETRGCIDIYELTVALGRYHTVGGLYEVEHDAHGTRTRGFGTRVLLEQGHSWLASPLYCIGR